MCPVAVVHGIASITRSKLNANGNRLFSYGGKEMWKNKNEYVRDRQLGDAYPLNADAERNTK